MKWGIFWLHTDLEAKIIIKSIDNLVIPAVSNIVETTFYQKLTLLDLVSQNHEPKGKKGGQNMPPGRK